MIDNFSFTLPTAIEFGRKSSELLKRHGSLNLSAKAEILQGMHIWMIMDEKMKE